MTQYLMQLIGPEVWAILGGILAAGVAFFYGKDYGKSKEQNKQLKREAKETEQIDEKIRDLKSNVVIPTDKRMRNDPRNRNRKGE